MKITTLLGTHRPDNYTQHALAVVETALVKAGAQVTRFDPHGKTLLFPGQPGENKDALLLEEMIRGADAVVIATPEYHGSFAAILKLMLENMGFPSALGTKPVALLGVAAGRIGAIKSLEHLRSVCSHTGALVLPGPISVAGVNRVFDSTGQCTDESTKNALIGLAKTVTDYLFDRQCPRSCLEAQAREGR